MGARSDYTGMDTYEQIRACLRCEKPECINCIYYADRNGTAQKRSESRATIKPARKNPKGKVQSNPCTACNAKLLCQANGWTCNAKARWEEKHG